MAAGEIETIWFTRHGSTPITELPAHWPADYRTLVERRIELIHGDRFIGLLEKPENKRRWNTDPPCPHNATSPPASPNEPIGNAPGHSSSART